MSKRTLICLLMLLPMLGVEVAYLVIGIVSHKLELAFLLAGLFVLGSSVWIALRPKQAMRINTLSKGKPTHTELPDRWVVPFFASLAVMLTGVVGKMQFGHPLFYILCFLGMVPLLVVTIVASIQQKK